MVSKQKLGAVAPNLVLLHHHFFRGKNSTARPHGLWTTLSHEALVTNDLVFVVRIPRLPKHIILVVTIASWEGGYTQSLSPKLIFFKKIKWQKARCLKKKPRYHKRWHLYTKFFPPRLLTVKVPNLSWSSHPKNRDFGSRKAAVVQMLSSILTQVQMLGAQGLGGCPGIHQGCLVRLASTRKENTKQDGCGFQPRKIPASFFSVGGPEQLH